MKKKGGKIIEQNIRKEALILDEKAKAEKKKIRIYGILIFTLAFFIYILSVSNGYALDDFIVILKNKFTQRGFSGISDILTKDTFAGMMEDNIMGLSGGRYRPLSVVTFAIEHQLLGNNPFLSHLINVIINALNCLLLFKLLLRFETKISREQWIPVCLFASLLFTLLPAHTEPVINIKGRDDLMSLLFFLLASHQLFNYSESGKKSSLAFSCLLFFLSLMSKETALTFIAIFPLMLIFFSSLENKKIRSSTIIYLSVGLVFLAFRYFATKDNVGKAEEEILNNPFLHASFGEKYATIILASLNYFKLMIAPVHLSYDYNYNQIPLMHFTDWQVIVSIVFHLALITAAVLLFKRKSVFSFSILFYFITFSILSNFFFNIGTTFADRFVYIPSIGYCLLLAALGHYSIQWLKEKTNSNAGKTIILGVFGIVSVLYLIRIVDRIGDWENNNTLFLADVDDAPNSAKVRINACLAYFEYARDKKGNERDSILNLAIPELDKAISIYPGYITSYLNMGVVYNWKGDFENAELWWDKARAIEPRNSKLLEYDKVLSTHYLEKGLKLGVENKIPESVSEMRKALKYDSSNAEIYFNLGGAYYTAHRFDSASYFWNKTIQINPDHQKVKQALQALPPNFK